MKHQLCFKHQRRLMANRGTQAYNKRPGSSEPKKSIGTFRLLNQCDKPQPSQSNPLIIRFHHFFVCYRDPRTRRLQEKQQLQQQKTASDGVPEKLSFKEKMKMFALESGEDQTPKDKLKISRAQRDIDAVH